MHPHFTRSRAFSESGSHATIPTALKSPASAGTAHGSGTFPFAGPLQAQQQPLQVNPLARAGGHEHSAIPESNVNMTLPYDRNTPLPIGMFSSEGDHLVSLLEGSQTQQTTNPDWASADVDSPPYRPYDEAQTRGAFSRSASSTGNASSSTSTGRRCPPTS